MFNMDMESSLEKALNQHVGNPHLFYHADDNVHKSALMGECAMRLCMAVNQGDDYSHIQRIEPFVLIYFEYVQKRKE